MATKPAVRHEPALETMSTEQFHDFLAERGITRAWLRYQDGRVSASHPELEPLARTLERSTAFQKHEALFIGREPGIRTTFFACVHCTRRGLAQGGLRMTSYTSIGDILFDGLRLSVGMTWKNAVSGIWWGGGKAIVPLPAGYGNSSDLTGPERKALMRAYGRFIASLGGVYYTAEDVGTTTGDMDTILAECRFVTCVSKERGGSGNPSPSTARGVREAMRAARKSQVGSSSLRDVRVAVQGVGNVGRALVELLAQDGALMTIADIDERAIAEVKRLYPAIQVVPPDEIFDVDADILAPCARGAQVNEETIPRLKVSLLVGASNNILRDEHADAQRLKERGILYVPDFWANRMGIVNCCNESFGADPMEVEAAASRIYPDTLELLQYAAQHSMNPVQAAHVLADAAAVEDHPMHPGRGQRLIEQLVQSTWAHDAALAVAAVRS